MQDKPHTQQELVKLEQCQNFLREQQVIDSDSFYELFNQIK